MSDVKRQALDFIIGAAQASDKKVVLGVNGSFMQGTLIANIRDESLGKFGKLDHNVIAEKGTTVVLLKDVQVLDKNLSFEWISVFKEDITSISIS
ncbi:hypothetical protein [Lacticaseibacillus suilingensis]|uniref:hypothetical protein n=1 Tax=Lacticaseibacillus suilingensis TaxID=2799577 RepID=UPI0022DF8273|nr:hypothetical protein [Lacticaseibacillus suilingensis]